MPNGIYAPMNAMKVASANPPQNPIVAESNRPQLANRHNAMLTRGNP
jgi:hypothetical protein